MSCGRILVTLITVASAFVATALAQSAELTGQSSAVAPAAATPLPFSTVGRSREVVVHWQNGVLSVKAQRASLHEVLLAISKQTGLEIESSPGADSGFISVEAGPGTMHDVLTAVLDGDQTNFILIGSRTFPGAVERLILTKVDSTALPTATQSTAAAAPAQPRLYGGGFSTESATAVPEDLTATTQPQQTQPITSPGSMQKTVDDTMSRYQQAYAEMAKSGKSRAEILNELQKQQIQDLDAAAAAQPPQQ